MDESGLNSSTCEKGFKILWVKVENKFKMRSAMQKKKIKMPLNFQESLFVYYHESIVYQRDHGIGQVYFEYQVYLTPFPSNFITPSLQKF